MATEKTIVEKIKKGAERLPESARQELYSYLQYLEYRELKQKNKVGTWTELAGSLSQQEADDLKNIIQEGCENVDSHEW